MDIDGSWLAIVIGLTLLCVLLTGPGMWSEKWGWGWFSRAEKGPARQAEERRPDQDGA